MKIIIINGSQKTGESNTGIILDELNILFKSGHEIVNYKLGTKQLSSEELKNIVSFDVIIFGFPLFNDSIPSNMLKMIIELESYFANGKPKNITVYAIINNGFYEGKQTHIAFEVIQNWCEHCGVKFGGGIGQGAGEMIGATKSIPIDSGPFRNLGRSLELLANKVELKETFEIKYLSPYFPRFLWELMSKYTFWHPLAYKNKLNKKDIVKKIV
ncbi:MAG: NAD(P)H-dependent oxidoreductase [Spirochaetaceae bacterium]|jgi:multimeric flavodoxin WrbA|nr:NAD(P)H-dependent oxidoreductase [Spirochaetaceae bacterium]